MIDFTSDQELNGHDECTVEGQRLMQVIRGRESYRARLSILRDMYYSEALEPSSVDVEKDSISGRSFFKTLPTRSSLDGPVR